MLLQEAATVKEMEVLVTCQVQVQFQRKSQNTGVLRSLLIPPLFYKNLAFSDFQEHGSCSKMSSLFLFSTYLSVISLYYSIFKFILIMWSSNCVYTCFPLQSLALLFSNFYVPFLFPLL